MTTTAKILIDENIAPRIAQELSRILLLAKPEETALIKHIHTLYEELGRERDGNWDETWFPHVKDDGWTILAGDRGKKSGKGKKLPDLCAQYGVTHVLLGPVVHDRPLFPKLLTILSVWHEVIDAANGPRGLRFQIEPNGMKPSHCGRGVLLSKNIPLSAPAPAGMLFRK